MLFVAFQQLMFANHLLLCVQSVKDHLPLFLCRGGTVSLYLFCPIWVFGTNPVHICVLFALTPT